MGGPKVQTFSGPKVVWANSRRAKSGHCRLTILSIASCHVDEIEMPEVHKLLPFVRLCRTQESPRTRGSMRRGATCRQPGRGRRAGRPTHAPVVLNRDTGRVRTSRNCRTGTCVRVPRRCVHPLPHRVHTLHSLLEAALWSVVGIRLHQGKTRAWNRGSIDCSREH